jgi:hypothetical protein
MSAKVKHTEIQRRRAKGSCGISSSSVKSENFGCLFLERPSDRFLPILNRRRK